MADKVLFTKSVDIVSVRKGIYKDPIQDFDHFTVLVKSIGKVTGDTVIDNMLQTTKNEAQLVFGWANVTVNEDGTLPEDFAGDMIDTVELESAAYNYVMNKGLANEAHMPGTDCGYLVESMMFTTEKMAVLGIPPGTIPEGWFVGFYIPNPEVYQKVKDGTYNMFSIEASAKRISLDATTQSQEFFNFS